jgi:hypothetical protein
MKFIPNFNYDLIERLTECDVDNRVSLCASRSAYGHDKTWVSKISDDTHKYPVVYSVNRQHVPVLHYSSKNTNGMFGESKVVFGSGATGFIIDANGEYGLTQWATGIIDDKENLPRIRDVLDSDTFKKEVVLAISVSKAEINQKILKYFKKDFWKEFA